MSALIRPRGALPARVYWVRRSLLLMLLFLLVFGLGRIVGGGSPEKPAAAAQEAASSAKPSPTEQARPFIGPQAFAPATGSGARATPNPSAQPSGQPSAQPTFRPTTPLPMPTNACDPQQITVTPVLAAARAGSAIKIPLDVSGTQAACRFEVSADALAVKVSQDGNRIWSTQDCPGAVTKQAIAVRSAGPTRVTVTWDGRRSDNGCGAQSKWATAGTYTAEAAVIGSEPAEDTFRLTLPPHPVVTQTASPKPQPTSGKGSSCGGDNAAGSC